MDRKRRFDARSSALLAGTFSFSDIAVILEDGKGGLKLECRREGARNFGARFNDYPWEDTTGHHKLHEHDKLVNYYRRRAYFHDPYIGPWMVMSSEELATLFHVLSSTVETPTMPRIASATAGAPANLPT